MNNEENCYYYCSGIAIIIRIIKEVAVSTIVAEQIVWELVKILLIVVF